MNFETLATGYELVEGPRTDEQNRLYFCDVLGGGVFRRSPSGEIEILMNDRSHVGGIALNDDGGLLVTGTSLTYREEQSGKLREIFNQWEGKPLIGLNDLTVDKHGSIWVGSFGCDVHKFDIKNSSPPPGSLFRVDPNGEVTHLWEGIEVTNGLGFSPDGKLLYHCDSSTRAVWAYEVNSDRTVSDRQIFAKLPDGMPDGMAVDIEGGVWVAVVAGQGEIVRFKPDGTIDQRINVPARTVTSVAFGGPDMCDFYTVTANNDQLDLKGTIFRSRSEVPGLPVPRARF
jgi:D-xylonolactonase